MNGAVPFEVRFLAQASDPDAAEGIASYDWDFDGDGVTDLSGTEPIVQHTYPKEGVFSASVTVTDRDSFPKKSSATVVVSLCPHGEIHDAPPAAMILAETPIIGPAPLTVKLEAFGSDMEGGTASATWSWDADGDGSLEGAAAGRTVTITGLSAGVHRIHLKITDEEDAGAGVAEIVVVATGAASGLPAWASADAITTSPQTPIQFHARSSGAVAFAWDFDGDGMTDSTEADPIYSYTLPGHYMPHLTVSNGADLSVATLSIVVEPCRPQEAGPYFRYKCPDVVMDHGTTANIVPILVTSIGGSVARSSQVLGKGGPLGLQGDPAAGEIVVSDPAGLPAPADVFGAPGPNPATPYAGGKVATVTSTLVHLFSLVKQYTIRIRLVDPGVRVQILKVQVYVIHAIHQN